MTQEEKVKEQSQMEVIFPPWRYSNIPFKIRLDEMKKRHERTIARLDELGEEIKRTERIGYEVLAMARGLPWSV